MDKEEALEKLKILQRQKAGRAMELPPPAELRRLRAKARVTQEEAAAMFEPPIQRSRLANWETGRGSPAGEYRQQYNALLEAFEEFVNQPLDEIQRQINQPLDEIQRQINQPLDEIQRQLEALEEFSNQPPGVLIERQDDLRRQLDDLRRQLDDLRRQKDD